MKFVSALIVLATVLAGSACGSEGWGGGIDQGFGSQDASGDVRCRGYDLDNMFMDGEVEITVTNNSSKASNYSIEVSAESSSGSTRYDTASFWISRLGPGQRTTETSMVFDTPDFFSCKVLKVSRTAS